MPVFRVDTELAKERYRRLAARYDHATRRMEPIRRRTIDTLKLERGQRVLDVACGTGKSLGMLSDAVGPEGEVVGVEQSAEMLAQARARVSAAGRANVTLVESRVEEAALRGPFDAVLFVYTQDVLRSRSALSNVFAATRPGARVASTGVKLFPWYLGAANVYLLAVSWPYFTTLDGLRRPWSLLEEHVRDLRHRSTFFGSGYIAWGRCA